MAGRPSRGMVVEVQLDPQIGHEQTKSRLCVVVQNDIGNRYSSTSIVVPLADATEIKKPSPIYVLVEEGDGGTATNSYILCDQIRTVDQRRFTRIHGTLSPATMAKVNGVLLISLGLTGPSVKRLS